MISAGDFRNGSEFHIRRLIKANRIKYIRTGAKYLVNFDKFVEYLNNGDN